VIGSDEFTSKNKDIWSIHIFEEVNFSQYLVKISFPKESSLHYMKTSNVLSIRAEDSLVIVITGNEEPLSFIAQYSLNKQARNNFLNSGVVLISILVIITVIVILFFVFNKTKKKSNSLLNNPSLTHRQQQI